MGTRFAALLVALVCVLAANDSEGQKLSEAIVDDGASLDVEETNDGDKRAEQEDYGVALEGMDPSFHQTSPNGVESSSKKLLSISQGIPRRYLRRRSRKRRALITASAPECEDTNQRYIVAALVAYSVLVLVLLFLLSFVCLRIRKKQRDEIPLHVLGTGDTSAGARGHTMAPPEPPPPPPETTTPAAPPPLPGKSLRLRRRTSTVRRRNASGKSVAPKPKLKPFFWDKLPASSDQSMVWHEIKAGSFRFNEEKMETLFGYTGPVDENKTDHKKEMPPLDSPRFIQIIETKKSQNLAISLKALNVTTEEVCDALKEGNELPIELTQSLVKMAPTEDEELKLRLYDGDIAHLGPVERFLKAMVDIPFAFKRLESLLFMNTFEEEFPSTKESLEALEVACKELRSSRLFLKLLEAVLKTGNRMNDGTYRGGAQGFKLDTLLKLSDVKGTDGNTTLLHFVVEEIIHSEGIRSANQLREIQSTDDVVEEYSNELEEYHWSHGLEVVLSLGDELQNVKKAAVIHTDNLRETVCKLEEELNKTKWFLDVEMNEIDEESEFCDALAGFVEDCESDIMWLKEEEKRIMTLVKSTWDYFHGQGGKEEGSHLFVIVTDFLVMLEKACMEVKDSSNLSSNTANKEASQLSPVSSPTVKGSCSESTNEIHSLIFPAMREQQLDDDFSMKKEGLQQLHDDFSMKKEGLQQLHDDFSMKKEGLQQLDDDLSLKKEGLQQLDDDFSLKKEGSQQLDDDFSLKEEASQQLDDDFSLMKEGSQQLDDDFSLKKEGSQQLDDDFSLKKEGSQQLDDDFSLKKEGLQQLDDDFSLKKEGSQQLDDDFSLKKEASQPLDDDFSMKKEASQSSAASLHERLDDDFSMKKEASHQLDDDFSLKKEPSRSSAASSPTMKGS